ncbi:demethylmenaquinone methyltransferase [Lucifera butyrica]|uniref:Putative 4-hydroxy-4-methyl-2-oxoglutarate aldolase n=1 Tax=Lucifera butyrica TaxID=1351585 RepID=A0A498RDI4_9FIRM|nr:RraA family protein [Lucifera butyrica]VBB09531.1 demethylmenaquinone methyltransferase [Lucifera butyrica]
MSNVGFRIVTAIKRPKKELIEKFRGIPVANIGDVMNRNYCLDARIRPINSILLLGTAFTVKTRPGDNLLLHKAIDMAAPGDIIVVDGQGDLTNSLIGELMISWAQQRGVSGFIIDGAIRDVTALRSMSIPVYTAGITPKGPYKDGPGEINVTITCGGVVVKPGDILVGDADSVIVIDPNDAPAILKRAEEKAAQETVTKEAIKNGTWNRSWVDKALKEKGCEFIN